MWEKAAVLLIGLLALPGISPGFAQEQYPARPVRVVVPFPPTSPIDVLARLVGGRLADHWGKPVYIDNKPGATGSIGTDMVAKASPDGYTLLFTVDFSLTMYPAVAKQLPYNPVADFKPIATIARTQNGVFVNPSLGVSTIDELVALAKSKPRSLSYSTAGIASPSHFATEQFNAAAGIEMLHVPYKGGPPAMLAVVTGETAVSFGPIPQALPQVRAGRLRALAVTGAAPSPLMPDVKPLIDQGFPNLIISNWFPVLAPARTAEPITRAIRDTLKRVVEEPDVRARLTSVGIDPAWEEAHSVTLAIQADLKRWAEVARRAGMEIQ
jgi:tripartite-type tricarboxylate transporter receptor subunit TctC